MKAVTGNALKYTNLEATQRPQFKNAANLFATRGEIGPGNRMSEPPDQAPFQLEADMVGRTTTSA